MKKLNHEVRIRFTKEQIDKLKQQASLLGLSLSAFCRLILLKAKVQIED